MIVFFAHQTQQVKLNHFQSVLQSLWQVFTIVFVSFSVYFMSLLFILSLMPSWYCTGLTFARKFFRPGFPRLCYFYVLHPSSFHPIPFFFFSFCHLPLSLCLLRSRMLLIISFHWLEVLPFLFPSSPFSKPLLCLQWMMPLLYSFSLFWLPCHSSLHVLISHSLLLIGTWYLLGIPPHF